MAGEEDATRRYSNVPIPDPSVVTQQIIDKAEAKLKDDYESKIQALHDNMSTRLDAMDRASVVLSENVNRVPTLLDREVLRVVDMLKRSEELMSEKFSAVAQQFKERDIRSDQDKSAASTAINAALSALKEMIGLQNTANAEAIRKSEAGFTNEINALKALINSTKETLAAQLGDMRSRIDRGEGSSTGSTAERGDNRASIGTWGVVIGASVAVISLLITFIELNRTPPQLAAAAANSDVRGAEAAGADRARIEAKIDALIRGAGVAPTPVR